LTQDSAMAKKRYRILAQSILYVFRFFNRLKFRASKPAASNKACVSGGSILYFSAL